MGVLRERYPGVSFDGWTEVRPGTVLAPSPEEHGRMFGGAKGSRRMQIVREIAESLGCTISFEVPEEILTGERLWRCVRRIADEF